MQFITKRQTERLAEGGYITTEIDAMLPEKPLFPIIMLLMALTKDGLDVLTLGFGGILLSFTLGFTLWMWMMLKSNFVYRRLWRWFLRRGVFLLLVGFVPLLNFLPEATILVLLIHHHENKVIQAFFHALERVRVAA